jgi:dual specificity MAP kinase phosphatase
VGLAKTVRILRGRLRDQGLLTTFLWVVDHSVRIVGGAPIRSMSEITPHIHLGGQHNRRGWSKLAKRGVTAVVNMRIEYDDRAAGIAPPSYLHLPTVDETAPSLEHLRHGVAFMAQQIAAGGVVYVHCASGIGRAATLVAAYMVQEGASPEQAWARIQAVRPFVRPEPCQIEQLTRFAAEQ